MNLFDMTVDNTTRERFMDESLYEALYSIADPVTQAKAKLHLEKIAKALKVSDEFKAMSAGYLQKQKKAPVVASTDFGGAYPEMLTGAYFVEETGIKTIDARGNEVLVAHAPVTIVRKSKNVQTETEIVTLAYHTGSGWREVAVSRDVISTSRKILELSAKGFPVISSTASKMVDYLAELEHLNQDRIPVEKSTSKMGWLGSEFVPYSDKYILPVEDVGLKKLCASIRCEGDAGKWMDCVKQFRQGSNQTVQVLISSALASVLVERLNALPFIVNVFGTTGMGKSVATKIATSVWAEPNKNYIGDFESTDVEIEVKADFLNSLPMVLDDTSKISQRYLQRFESMVYALASGKGRSRSNISLGIERERTWALCTITNGERPLTSLCTQGGAEARILELPLRQKLFDKPLEVIDLVEHNFGHLGKRFVEVIQGIGKDELLTKYKEMEHQIIAEIPNALGKHIASMAVLLTADAIATEYIFQDDKYILMETVSDMVKTEAEVSDYEQLYHKLVQYVYMNPSRFDGSAKQEQYGFFKQHKYTIFYELGFVKVCKSLGYPKPKDFILWAVRSGFILVDPNRLNKTTRLPDAVAKRYAEDNGKAPSQLRCIWLKMESEQPPEGEDEDDGYTYTNEEIDEWLRAFDEQRREEEENDAIEEAFFDSLTNDERREYYEGLMFPKTDEQ